MLQLRCSILTNRMWDTEKCQHLTEEPKNYREECSIIMTQSSVSPLLVVFFLFLSFRQLSSEIKKTTSVPLKYLKQALAAVTDRWQAESFKKSCLDKTEKEFARPLSDKTHDAGPHLELKVCISLYCCSFETIKCLFFVVNRLGIKLPSPQIFCASHLSSAKNQEKILWSVASRTSPPSGREGFQK